VRGQKNRSPGCLEVGDDLVDEPHALRIESRVRLVHQSDLDGAHQELPERQPLPHSGGEGPHAVVRHFGEADPFENAGDYLAPRLQARHPHGEMEVLGGGEVVVQEAAHRQKAGSLPDLVRVIQERVPHHVGVAPRRAQQGRDELQERGLPGSVRPDEAQSRSGLHVNAGVAQSPVPPESLRKSIQF
jgi:hypothetical protein